jgi:hypothetical protein
MLCIEENRVPIRKGLKFYMLLRDNIWYGSCKTLEISALTSDKFAVYNNQRYQD